MLVAHARALLDNHSFENVVAQGVQLHRFGLGATIDAQRRTLSELIASRDAFEALFKRQAAAAKQAGLLADLDVDIAVKIVRGSLQWSLSWYQPEAERAPDARDVVMCWLNRW